MSSALGAAAEQLDTMVDDGESSVEDMVSEMNRLIAAITASTAGGPHRFKSLVHFFGVSTAGHLRFGNKTMYTFMYIYIYRRQSVVFASGTCR